MATGISTNFLESQNHGDAIEDMISNLPEGILGQILSLLPMKIAVSTGVVSKRWKLLWTLTINLDFYCPKNCARKADQFVQFVHYVLPLHKHGYLNRFSITWETGCIPVYINIWIFAAVFKKAHELIVHCNISDLPIIVQRYLFRYEGLQSLELNCNICIFSKIMVSLPRLESLKLISVYFQNENAFCEFLNGCPKLKSLVIKMDIGKMIGHDRRIMMRRRFVLKKFLISLTYLTHLELNVYGGYASSMNKGICHVELNTPSLRGIVLEEHIFLISVKQKCSVLDEAKIQITGLKSVRQRMDGDEHIVHHYFKFFVQAIHSFQCAKTLTLDNHFIWALSRSTIKIETKFDRLKRLEVKINSKNWSSLQDIIELSNNLEVLVVNKARGYSIDRLLHSNGLNWKKPNIVPICLSNSLRIVSISAYDGCDDEHAMIKYIIKNGSVLKDIHICFGERITNLSKKYELVEKISSFFRKSTICEVKFDKQF